MRCYTLLFALTLSMSIISSKDKGNCDAGDPIEKIIIGTWELKSVFNPWTGETTYPVEAGYTVTITYNDDGTYELIDSRETDIETGTYLVYDSPVIDCAADMCISVIEGSAYTITCDQLIYDNTPVDGPRLVYERK